MQDAVRGVVDANKPDHVEGDILEVKPDKVTTKKLGEMKLSFSVHDITGSDPNTNPATPGKGDPLNGAFTAANVKFTTVKLP